MTDAPAGSPRILLVEDEAVVRIALADTLVELGFRVEPTGSATEAMDRLRDLDGGIDAAIVDIGLPDRSGDALALELRALVAGLPILIATGDVADDLRQRFGRDSRVAFLAKPYDGAGIVPLLRALGVRDPGDGAPGDG